MESLYVVTILMMASLHLTQAATTTPSDPDLSSPLTPVTTPEPEDDCYPEELCLKLQRLGMSCMNPEFAKHCAPLCEPESEDSEDSSSSEEDRPRLPLWPLVAGRRGPLIELFAESNVAIKKMDVSLQN